MWANSKAVLPDCKRRRIRIVIRYATATFEVYLVAKVIKATFALIIILKFKVCLIHCFLFFLDSEPGR